MSKIKTNNKLVLEPSAWIYLYSELSNYIQEYSSLDPIWTTDSNGDEIRTEEKQDEFINIADTVEAIMRTFLNKGEN